ncbi:MAG TPA: 50S ribosomal protein L6 [Gemmatimonadota bacterium]|nr:50S ribosomal protein L6 [Gemmatimonadota bacterium]
MSRIGKQPVVIPDGVTIQIDGRDVRVKGPKGEVGNRLPAEITAKIDDGQVMVERSGDDSRNKAMHGLARSLVANMVEGVTEGFTKRLEIVGVGYRADASGEIVRLNLGYSHQIEYPVPPGIEVKTPSPTVIEVSGADKQVVGQVAAELRSMRPTEPYKGKGIKYEGEYVRRKAGKTGV